MHSLKPPNGILRRSLCCGGRLVLGRVHDREPLHVQLGCISSGRAVAPEIQCERAQCPLGYMLYGPTIDFPRRRSGAPPRGVPLVLALGEVLVVPLPAHFAALGALRDQLAQPALSGRTEGGKIGPLLDGVGRINSGSVHFYASGKLLNSRNLKNYCTFPRTLNFDRKS